jgi:diguanylate cyclase (GGDEF)-like protein
MELSYLAFNIQVLSVVPVSVLLWQLTRAVSGRFLVYWAAGWVMLVGALLSLRLTVLVEPNSTEARLGYTFYCCLEYVFGFLLWAGCRELATGERLRRDNLWGLAPALAFGLIAPWTFGTTRALYAFHAPIFGAFFLLALWSTRAYRPAGEHPSLGIHVVRVCLAVLGVLFVHYGPVTYWTVWMDAERPGYMTISALYDALAEVGLAFGMAMVAIERVRGQLTDANRKLADVSEQLAIAARTDHLTGLLNRRALDAMLAEREHKPFAGAVAMVDLNNLKRINDELHHAAGDAAIKHVARALRGQFRIDDLVFRVGGDEFLVVVENGRAVDLVGRLEAVDAALKGQRLPGLDEPVDLVIAWGLADFDRHAEFDDACSRADAAMYACKVQRKAAVAG